MPDRSPQFALDRLVGADHQRVVVIVGGEIDLATGSRLTRILRDAQLEARHVVLDLHRSTFIDTGGVRVLLAAQARARATAGTFAICRPPPHVRRMLRLMGADRLLVVSFPGPDGTTPFVRAAVSSAAPLA